MRQVKIISSESQKIFEEEINSFIKEYPEAIIQYQAGQSTYNVRFTALIDYKTKE